MEMEAEEASRNRWVLQEVLLDHLLNDDLCSGARIPVVVDLQGDDDGWSMS